MQEFVDLEGASGVTYRFRRLPDGTEHQRIAGNYAYLRPNGEGVAVVLVGFTNDLSSVGRRAPAGQRGARLFTRLNVARSVREAEHQDLAARHPTAEAGPDAGA